MKGLLGGRGRRGLCLGGIQAAKNTDRKISITRTRNVVLAVFIQNVFVYKFTSFFNERITATVSFLYHLD
ncbi:hypothetical protein A8C56_17750 [Niabella ginsenosidivorans]|uniref:Uncharacterized protein n=1 Tax=Niabella ginsenosidivorans TaxID=1176587 RepID=A0A1A9I7R8_9BACT|nr:hypothetical protein A8C56_17750 [Niabella ginsenosidivorans]